MLLLKKLKIEKNYFVEIGRLLIFVHNCNKILFLEIMTEAEYLSVDPYMRAYMIAYKLPTDMIGGQLAKYVLVSRIFNLKLTPSNYILKIF